MFENFHQVVADHFGISTFDVMPLNKMNKLPIFEQGHCGGGRRVG